MEWWDGDGAARVLARDADALLLERATGSASPADMARSGRDNEACRILCAVAARLHAPRTKPLPELIPPAALVSRAGADGSDARRHSRPLRRDSPCPAG